MNLLTDVTIEELRGVGRMELHFAPDQRVYTLFGANGVGKTKCLEALYLSLLMANKDFQVFLGKKHKEQSKLVLTKGHLQQHVGLRLPRFGQIQPELETHQLPVVLLGAGWRMNLEAGNAVTGDALGKTADRREKYFDALWQAFTQNNDLRTLSMSDNTRAWFVTRAQSSNPYQKSRDNRQSEIEAVLAMLYAIEPRIGSKFLQIDGAGGVFLKVDGEERELGELSSGFAALLKMIQAIIAGYAAFTNEVQLQNVRGIVLIDEIDAHLHAQWQTRILPTLKKLLPNTTFYVTTHSPLVLTQLENGEAYLLERHSDGVVRSKVIKSANRRLLVDVLDDGFGVDLNQLKRDRLEREDQTEGKAWLRDLLRQREEAGS